MTFTETAVALCAMYQGADTRVRDALASAAALADAGDVPGARRTIDAVAWQDWELADVRTLAAGRALADQLRPRC